MTIQFFNVKTKKKVDIDEKDVKKTKYERQTKEGKTQVRYAFKAESDGVKLTKFASQADWEKLNAPEV